MIYSMINIAKTHKLRSYDGFATTGFHDDEKPAEENVVSFFVRIVPCNDVCSCKW